MTDFDRLDLNNILESASKLVANVERAVESGMKHNSSDARAKAVNTDLAKALHQLKKELGNGNPTTK